MMSLRHLSANHIHLWWFADRNIHAGAVGLESKVLVYVGRIRILAKRIRTRSCHIHPRRIHLQSTHHHLHLRKEFQVEIRMVNTAAAAVVVVVIEDDGMTYCGWNERMRHYWSWTAF